LTDLIPEEWDADRPPHERLENMTRIAIVFGRIRSAGCEEEERRQVNGLSSSILDASSLSRSSFAVRYRAVVRMSEWRIISFAS
jgi:hypothetical protein